MQPIAVDKVRELAGLSLLLRFGLDPNGVQVPYLRNGDYRAYLAKHLDLLWALLRPPIITTVREVTCLLHARTRGKEQSITSLGRQEWAEQQDSSDSELHVYTLCLEKFPPLNCLQLCQILTDFHIFALLESAWNLL